MALDEFPSDQDRLQDVELWWRVLKNVRAGLMPPKGKPRPSPQQIEHLSRWIKETVFRTDPNDPDPGRVTLRRLNRVEYQNTIRDLMGVEFRADEEFPPDDTGYGFDNIGDVLRVSPLLLEKYMQAAETIVAQAVPTVTKVAPIQQFRGNDFSDEARSIRGNRLSFYEEAELTRAVHVEHSGTYTLAIELEVDGEFDFDPGRCAVTFRADGEILHREEYQWNSGHKYRYDFEVEWAKGEHELAFGLKPLVAVEDRRNNIRFEIRQVKVIGPLEEKHWIHPPNYDRFFTLDSPPNSGPARFDYARETLSRLAGFAFRRPADPRTVERLAAIARFTAEQPGETFESGVARALVALLASPRFIFRVEMAEPAAEVHPWVDEHTLATRLSYFLWSTMPDERLLQQAEAGTLRANLPAEVQRMLADPRAEALTENFVGQWLNARDLAGISINERAVLSRDAGEDKEMNDLRARFMALRRIPEDQLTPEQKEQLDELRARFRRLFRQPGVELDGDLRRAMRRETELSFSYILKEDRSLLELLESNYTFLNERLAKHYGIPNVEGREMRRVDLPPQHPRGGILTQGTVLVATSNPSRTSPVKRGLFVLDNILGTPAPPPPDAVPDLEEAEKGITDHEPTLREALELHRSEPLCRSCHARMDPLGLALENFNALGMWREQERKQPIEPSGELITGEKFQNIVELKHILATDRRDDFLRCLTDKLMTYALGRGLEFYDVHSIDEIVARLHAENYRASALLTGIIESAPFQKRRADPATGGRTTTNPTL